MFHGLFRFFVFSIILMMIGLGSMLAGWVYFGRDLPEYTQLRGYEPPVMTRIYAADGRLMAEYGREKRVFVPIEMIPQHVVDAFLSAEDKDFYKHPGVDVPSILGAVINNIPRLIRRQRMVGASTITQQVAKNFLIGGEYKLTRKIKEAILAVRIERAFEKDRILELYLNQIFLGYRSYGVAAAAQNYFDKSLEDLSIGEAAYLAALPKAPNNYHPVRLRDAAVNRRNWVVGRMLEDQKITTSEAEAAWSEPFEVADRQIMDEIRSHYFAEEVRRELQDRYGEQRLYEGGLAVRATLDPVLQKIAAEALREGLMDYDLRHGWRGPLGKLTTDIGWQQQVADHRPEEAPDNWPTAVVRRVEKGHVVIDLGDGTHGTIPFAEMRWARPARPNQTVGAVPRSPRDVVEEGDIILVERVTEKPTARNKKRTGKQEAEVDPDDLYPPGTFTLRQLPEVEGGLVVMDPQTGRVLAMQGGFSTDRSQFNRATQAMRQPGSSFKPFVYLAALESGYPPNTIVYDLPFYLPQGPGQKPWAPSNYDGKVSGPSTIRVGIERSRNLMTVRLADAMGMDKIVDYAKRFGIDDDMLPALSMSLGAGETTVLRMVGAYSMIVNGGRKIVPTFIDRVQDRHGKTIYRHDTRSCPACQAPSWRGQSVPEKLDTRQRVVSEASAYQMVSFLRGVVQRGTAVRLASLNAPIGGKTGTTNDYRDSWFIGFTSDMVVGSYVGFDQPRSLGRGEAGSRVALPVVKKFLSEALEYRPAHEFTIPEDIKLVPINRSSGVRARGGIMEAFKVDEVPPPGIGGPVIGFESEMFDYEAATGRKPLGFEAIY